MSAQAVLEPGVRAKKVPLVMQMEALECGAACLTMVAAYYGKWVPLEEMRTACGVSRDGSKASNILKAARRMGFEAKGKRFSPERLKEAANFPCIIHWNFNHFVVLDGFKGDTVYINDPGAGEVKIPYEEFDRSYTGICLNITPGPDFEPSGEPPSIKDFALERLKGSAPMLVFVALTTAILSLLGIVNPAFSQVFLDQILSLKSPDWFWPFIFILIGICIVQVVVQAINGIYLKRLEGKMAVVSNSSFFWKVLHLPMGFFAQRMAGDITSRASSSADIANELVGRIAPLIVNFVLLALYVVIMYFYSWLLATIGIASVAVNLWVAGYISRRRINILRVQMRDDAQLFSTTVSGIDMIETLKASGAEQGFFQRWAGFQAGSNSQHAKYFKTDTNLSMIPQLITSLANISVLVIGLWLVMAGDFTIGMILAFQGYLTNFIAPAQTLTETLQSFQEMRTSMERIDDVMKYPSDPLALAGATSDEPLEKLSGDVTLDHVTFGYSPLEPPLIEDFSMHVRSGGSVAFVGASGSGKSTLSKLLSGLYLPWEGTVSFDGRDQADVPKSVRTGSLAVIDQDIVLFNDTVANNIRLWDDSIEDFEVILAARDAAIHSTIMEKDGGYDHMVLDGGKDFSGGQRQRLEIARALAQDPTILVMDEATSALDAQTELEVMSRIRRRGITTVIIAHRLSAIRDCDEIIVLDRGRVVERGTHEELMELGGVYKALVMQA